MTCAWSTALARRRWRASRRAMSRREPFATSTRRSSSASSASCSATSTSIRMPEARALLLGVAIAVTPFARAQEPAPAPDAAAKPARRVDPRADEILKKMSALLAGAPRFALEAEETLEEVSDNAPRVQLTNVRRIGVERPGRFAADAAGDTLNRAAWYDGKTLTVLDKSRNVYLSVEMPGGIDAALDRIADEYGVVIPLSDLLYADPYATLTEGVAYGEYLGLHQAAGTLCHHLAFSQDAIDWQIWIDAGDQPLPRKLVITYVNEPGTPQYMAVIRRFTLDPKFQDGLFQFHAPEGAQRIDVSAARRLKEEPR